MRRAWHRSAGIGRAAALLATCLASAGCGISSSSGFDPIDQPATVPTAPPSTTTTEAPPPPSSPGSAPGDPGGGSTVPTQPNVAVEPVTLYFATTSIVGPELTQETRMMSQPATLPRVIGALVEGPEPGSGDGLQTWIPEGLIVDISAWRGVARVELDVDLMTDKLTGAQQRLAIGQLVLTLGNRPGIGQVQFTRDGKPYSVPNPARDGQTDPRPLAADDFASFVEPDPDSAPGMEPT